LKTDIFRAISKKYRKCGRIKHMNIASGHSINSVNYIVDFDNGLRVICKHVKNLKDKDILGMLRIVNFLSEKKVRVPNIVESDSGDLAVKCKQGISYLLLFQNGDSFDGSISELKDFAYNLAIFHKKLRRCTIPSPKFHLPKRKHLTKKELDSIFNILKRKRNLSDFDDYILKNFEFIKSCFDNYRLKNKKINKMHIITQCIHKDLHPGNVLFNNRKVMIILDTDSISRGERIRDVSFACFRFSQHKSKNKEEIKRKVKIFLREYMAHNTLNKDETHNVKHYFIKECLNRISYILRGHYFDNQDEWDFDLKKHIDNIKMADEVFDYE